MRSFIALLVLLAMVLSCPVEGLTAPKLVKPAQVLENNKGQSASKIQTHTDKIQFWNRVDGKRMLIATISKRVADRWDDHRHELGSILLDNPIVVTKIAGKQATIYRFTGGVIMKIGDVASAASWEVAKLRLAPKKKQMNST